MTKQKSHFCNGEDKWKRICFECKYPTREIEREHFLKEISRLREVISELTSKKRKTRPQSEIKEREIIQELRGVLKSQVLNYSRTENKLIEIIDIVKNIPHLKNKIEKIIYSGNRKYDKPNYLSRFKILEDKDD